MKPVRLAEDGKLVIPLLHGTSSLFLPSIHAHGFGGLDPLENLKVRDFARRVLAAVERRNHRMADRPDQQHNRILAHAILNQTNGRVDWRSGMYMTPSFSLATMHAFDKRVSGAAVGSELLHTALYCYRWLELHALNDEELAVVRGDSRVPDLLKMPSFPVILEVKDVPVNGLEGWGRMSTEEAFRRIRAKLKGLPVPSPQALKALDACLDVAFRFSGLIPAERVSVYKLRNDGRPDAKLHWEQVAELPNPFAT